MMQPSRVNLTESPHHIDLVCSSVMNNTTKQSISEYAGCMLSVTPVFLIVVSLVFPHNLLDSVSKYYIFDLNCLKSFAPRLLVILFVKSCAVGKN